MAAAAGDAIRRDGDVNGEGCDGNADLVRVDGEVVHDDVVDEDLLDGVEVIAGHGRRSEREGMRG